MIALFNVFVLLLIQNITCDCNNKEDLSVTVANGRIRGTKNLTSIQKKTFFAFRGIPFAVPPLGDLRFAAPVPAKNWSGILDATKDRDECMQVVATTGSEDCLYINVYTPQAPCETNKLPVIVWIYGGAFILGDSKYEHYGPDYFLEEDVILVSFNYRLGIFGFLSTQDMVAPGNWGIKDQLLALKWVQTNIGFFGGDVNNITVFGQSAGAVSASLLQLSPLAAGLFHKVILNSGTAVCGWTITLNPKDLPHLLALRFGVDASSSQSLVDGLRKVSAKDLQTASFVKEYAVYFIKNVVNGFPQGPVIEPDHEGAVLTNKSLYTKYKNGDFARIPLLTGFNSLEMRYFDDLTALMPWYYAVYDLDSKSIVPGDMFIKNSAVKEIVGREIKKHYYGNNLVVLNFNTSTKMFSDTYFIVPITKMVSIINSSIPTYLYRFSYEGDLGYKRKRIQQGVAHTEELNYLFRNDYPATPLDAIVRRRLVRMWSNFAKTGNPTPVKDELLDNVIWPKVHKNNDNDVNYLDIGGQLVISKNPQKNDIEFWDKLYEKYARKPYFTF